MEILDPKTYKASLHEKLMEEALELMDDPSLEELADILEITHAILALRGVSFEDLEQVWLKKLGKNKGGFGF